MRTRIAAQTLGSKDGGSGPHHAAAPSDGRQSLHTRHARHGDDRRTDQRGPSKICSPTIRTSSSKESCKRFAMRRGWPKNGRWSDPHLHLRGRHLWPRWIATDAIPRETRARGVELKGAFDQRFHLQSGSLEPVLEVHHRVQQNRRVDCRDIARWRSRRREIARGRNRERVIAIQIRGENYG